MTDTDTHLTIGAFSRASRLSHRALRLYGDLGLLLPARVDELTGYRHYSPDQLGRAQLIGLLRQLGLSLGEVRAVLDTPAPARAAQFAELWARAEREHGRRRALAQYLSEKLQGETEMTVTYDVQQRFVPAVRVATLSRRLDVAELQDFSAEAGDRLVALTGPQTAGAAFVIYHGQVNADSDGPVEVCVPFSGALTLPPDVTVREEPAHFEAFTTLTKAEFVFPDILRAYDATHAYAQAHGTLNGLSPREVYPLAWKTAGEDDPAGDVAFPFTPRG